MESGAEPITVFSLFLEADPVVKGVMLILALASIWSWAIAVDKWLHFGDLEQNARKFEREFWSGRSLDDTEERGDRPRDALSRVYAAASREWREARRAGAGSENAQLMLDRVDRLMQAQISREMQRASRYLGVLATVGASAPFIGLFGTVWGIMNAFTNIAAQQQTNLAVVAPGIAEALFATALGLVAAIPAVIFYNKFTGDLDRFGDRLDTFSDEVAARLLAPLERAQLMAGAVAGSSRRGRRGRRSARRTRLSEINVTPFVDVMLVLLIVFMVTAPLLTVGVPIDLPRTEAKQLESETDPLTISIRADGTIFVQETVIDKERLIPQMRAISREGYDRRIFIRADATADYGLVADVMARLSSSGFRNLGLVTDTRDSPRRAAPAAEEREEE